MTHANVRRSKPMNPPGESGDSTLIEPMLPHRYSNRYRRFAPISRAVPRVRRRCDTRGPSMVQFEAVRSGVPANASTLL